MAHVRKQIRDRIAVELANLTTTKRNVHKSRVYPYEADDLPALNIYPTEEESEIDTDEAITRSVHMVVAATARAGEDVEDLLDTIAEEIETAISKTLNGLAKVNTLISTTFDRSSEGDAELEVMELTFEVEYRTNRGVPGSSV